MNEQRKCFHYTNLRPPWAADNIGLGARNCDLTVGCVRFGANGRAAKRSYESTAQQLGFTRAAARQWASTVLRRLKEEVAELQGTGPMKGGDELSFPKIISARTDDEPGPDGSKERKPHADFSDRPLATSRN